MAINWMLSVLVNIVGKFVSLELDFSEKKLKA